MLLAAVIFPFSFYSRNSNRKVQNKSTFESGFFKYYVSSLISQKVLFFSFFSLFIHLLTVFSNETCTKCYIILQQKMYITIKYHERVMCARERERERFPIKTFKDMLRSYLNHFSVSILFFLSIFTHLTLLYVVISNGISKKKKCWCYNKPQVKIKGNKREITSCYCKLPFIWRFTNY